MTSWHERVAFAVPKRYNTGLDPATFASVAALGREYPFLNNTEVRIVAALSRPGPVVEICT